MEGRDSGKDLKSVRSTTASGSQVYESKRAVFEYLFFHYSAPEELFPFDDGPSQAFSFPARCAEVCVSRSPTEARKRALDLGCAVGASAFHLAKHFDQVVGVDFSQHFVDAANHMKKEGKKLFEVQVRGSVFEEREACVDPEVDRSRVTFLQGDACNLDKSLGKFDVILGANLLCRLPKPRKFLQEVAQFLNPGGSLVLVSPYSWLEEYTAKEDWIGATEEDPNSREALSKEMAKSGFSLVHGEDMPFLIREHERKYQYGVSDCTIWTKVIRS